MVLLGLFAGATCVECFVDSVECERNVHRAYTLTAAADGFCPPFPALSLNLIIDAYSIDIDACSIDTIFSTITFAAK